MGDKKLVAELHVLEVLLIQRGFNVEYQHVVQAGCVAFGKCVFRAGRGGNIPSQREVILTPEKLAGLSGTYCDDCSECTQ